jgi:uncharacterized protein YdhG (YjbR/CyaY superfamily)
MRQRTEHYYMTPEERREYHRRKSQEHKERLAVLRGWPIRHHDPNSHPSQMSYEERLKYNREALHRYKERIKQQENDRRTRTTQ